MRPSNISVICCVIAGWATGSAAPPPSPAPAPPPPCEDKGGVPFCQQWVGTIELKLQNCMEEPWKSKCEVSCGKCLPPCTDNSPDGKDCLSPNPPPPMNIGPSPPPPKTSPSPPRPGAGSGPPHHVFTSTYGLLRAAQAYNNNPANVTRKFGPIETWDVSSITNMRGLFKGLKDFNSNISSWNTSRVTDMSHMFEGAVKFNQPLSFDTSSVTDLSAMFDMSSDEPDPCRRRLSFGSAFNYPLSFDTSRVVSMEGMFQGASAFNQPLSFDTSSVTDMSQMFQGATAYNQPLSFDTSRVIDMADMLAQASAFNKPLSFDTSHVIDMHAMFQQAVTFNQPLSFDTSSVTDMSNMLQGAISFYQPLSFDFSSVVDMSCMFAVTSCEGPSGRRRRALSCIGEDKPLVFNRPIILGTTKRVTDLSGMFAGSAFNQPVSLDTSTVTTMQAMFRDASAFNQPLTFNTSRVTDMSDMFRNATAFNQPLSFDTSSVTDMGGMFQATSSLSDANKLIIRCAWAGNPAFDSAYGLEWVAGACSPHSPSLPPMPPPMPPLMPRVDAQSSTCNCSEVQAELEAKLKDMEERLADEAKLRAAELQAMEERTAAALEAIRQFILMTPPSTPPSPTPSPPPSPLPPSPPSPTPPPPSPPPPSPMPPSPSLPPPSPTPPSPSPPPPSPTPPLPLPSPLPSPSPSPPTCPEWKPFGKCEPAFKGVTCEYDPVCSCPDQCKNCDVAEKVCINSVSAVCTNTGRSGILGWSLVIRETEAPPCPPPRKPKPPPPPPPQQRPVVCGNPGLCSETPGLRDPNELHEVRCCSNVKLSSAWGSMRPGCYVWGASNAGWPCKRGQTFAQAKAICQGVGARLCTAAELMAGCTTGTGCQFDFELVWGV